MPRPAFRPGRESPVALVMAIEAERLQVRPVKPSLPAALGLNRIDVMHLDGDGTAIFTAVASVLHLCLRHPLPVVRGIEAGVLRIPLRVVAGVPL